MNKNNKARIQRKKEAQIALSQLQVNFEKNHQQLTNKTSLTFKKLYELWLKQYRLKVKPSTVATSRQFISKYCLQYFEKLKLDKITVLYCQEIFNKWHFQYKLSHYFREIVAQFLQLGIKIEIIDSNPMRKTELPRKIELEQFPYFYSKQQLEHFFICSNNNFKYFDRTNTKLLVFFSIDHFHRHEKIRSFSFTMAGHRFYPS